MSSESLADRLDSCEKLLLEMSKGTATPEYAMAEVCHRAAAALRDYKALTGLEPEAVPEILESWSHTAPPPPIGGEQ